jgi:hypothetical protein
MYLLIQVIGPGPLLYVSVREYAVTHPHDNKISVLGTDDVTTNLVLLLRHSGSGAVGLTQVHNRILVQETDDVATTYRLIKYQNTKAKCCHLKKFTCKGTLWQVFIRVFRLEIQSVMLVSST